MSNNKVYSYKPGKSRIILPLTYDETWRGLMKSQGWRFNELTRCWFHDKGKQVYDTDNPKHAEALDLHHEAMTTPAPF